MLDTYGCLLTISSMFFSSLADVVKSLVTKHVIEEEYMMVVWRNNVINDAIKRMEHPGFYPGKKVAVSELPKSER